MRPLIVALVVALGACSSIPFEPGRGSLAFTARGLPLGQQHDSAVHTTGGMGIVDVSATLAAPDPCQRLSADLQGHGATIVLQVAIAPRVAAGCATAIGHYEYEARISGLPRGSYDIEVVHTYPGTGWEPFTTRRQVHVQ